MAVNGWQAVLVLLEGLSEVRHLHSAAPVPVKCIEDRLDQEDVRLGVPGSESGERGIVVVRVSRLWVRASLGRKAHCASGAACSLSVEPLLALAASFCWIRPLRFSAAKARWGREHLRHGVAGEVRQGRPSPRRRRVSSLLRSEDAWLSSTACSRACRASTGFEFGAESLVRALRSSSCAPSFRRPGESF